MREQSRIHINKAPATHVVAGLLAEGASLWPDDRYAVGVERDLWLWGVIYRGPDRMPGEAFTDQLHESLLG